MPNYCHNTLIFNSDKDTILQLKSDIINNDNMLSFEKLLPTPVELITKNIKSNDELLILQQKYGYDNWYNWRIANWGTKWDAIDSVINFEDQNNINISFETAWCPPMNWLFYTIEKYNKLNVTIKFIDEMGGLIGLYKIENGETVIEGYFNDYDYEIDGDFDDAIMKRINPIMRRKKLEKIRKNIN